MNLLMISGDRSLAQGKKGAFWNTISELHKHFARIDIITPRIPEHRYDMVIFGNVHIHPSPFPLLLQPLWVWYKARRLAESLPLTAGDTLITCHSYPPFYNDIGAWFAHRSTGIPYLLEVLHVPGVPRAANPKEAVYRWTVRLFFRWFARQARAVRVMNEHETPAFLVRSGVPREKLVTIPAVYLDTEVFYPRDVPKHFDLVFVGRLVKNKRPDLFIDIVHRSGLRGLVVGEGPLLKKLKAKSQKLKARIKFHGYARDQDEVAELISSARLLVMVSSNEGGPRVVVEALACGVPVLATPVGIVPDILPPEAIEEWNVAALTEKVRNILADHQLYDRLRSAGLYMAQRYERDTAITRYAEALKKLAVSS